ncbi:hypothetical protein WN944_001128 [Citrus x changshan-huyou]|uniref:PRA1 family protein n=1 Tax=Citrus x changshan-huyou TaxID=2935761 RepID=A0AAP0QUH4_9ROSI
MADVIRACSFQSLRFSSSSVLTSFSSTSGCPQLGLPPNQISDNKRIYPLAAASSSAGLARFSLTPRKRLLSFKAHATLAETNQPKWWEKNAPNMIDIHSTQEFLEALSQAGDRLVIVEFYGTCIHFHAKLIKTEVIEYKRNGETAHGDAIDLHFVLYAWLLCRTAEEHPEIVFLKVNFDENKPMCKSLNVKVLPYFHFYRGAHGQLESFSCSLAKFQKIKEAIALHNTDRCSIGPPKGVGDLSLEVSLTGEWCPQLSRESPCYSDPNFSSLALNKKCGIVGGCKRMQARFEGPNGFGFRFGCRCGFNSFLRELTPAAELRRRFTAVTTDLQKLRWRDIGFIEGLSKGSVGGSGSQRGRLEMASYLWRKYADYVYTKWERTLIWDMIEPYRRPKSFTPLVSIYVAAFYTGVIAAAINEQLYKEKYWEDHPGEAVPLMRPTFYGGPWKVTGFGETPELSSQPLSTRVKRLIESGFGTPRPWDEFIQIQSINLPTSFANFIERIQSNAAFYRMNYAVIILSIIVVSLFWNPVSLIILIILIAAWLFLYFLRDGDRLVVYGFVIDDRILMTALLLGTIAFLFLTDVTKNIIIGLCIGTVVIAAHAGFRSTDDMFSADDEERLGSLQSNRVAPLPLKHAASPSSSS